MIKQIYLQLRYNIVPNTKSGGYDVVSNDDDQHIFHFHSEEIEDHLEFILRVYERGFNRGYKSGELETLEFIKDSINIDLEHMIKNVSN